MAALAEHAASRLADALGPAKVSTDLLDRIAYSCDASLYQLVPEIVVRAESIADVIELFAWSRRERIPLTFRAAGTSLSGQAVTNHALVVLRGFDCLHIPSNGQAVRAGCTLRGGYVNGRLRSYHRRIGPDPASIDACTIGGIVANNASGMCCGIAQNAYHTLVAMRLVLLSGTVLDTSDLEAADQLLAEREPAVYAGLCALRDQVRGDAELARIIRHRTRLKNTMGYSIAAFLDFERPADILQHLLVGSEGTLGFIADVTLRTIDEPPHATTALLGYRSLHDACAAVDAFDAEGAVAIELMDQATLAAIALHAGGRAFAPLPRTAALLVEFRYDDAEQSAAMSSRVTTLAQKTAATSLTLAASDRERHLLWQLRKGAMPSVGAARPPETALINEDVAFPRQHLAAAVHDLRSLLLEFCFSDAVIFGHARDGNMHFAFALDAAEHSIERYGRFMDEVAALVVERYDGSLKAEHSTGRNMAPYLERQWGERATALMWQLKELLDPDRLLNRDVLLSRDQRIHLRNIKQLPSVHHSIDRCIECGFCERACPSSGVTLSPRQRIVALRQIERATALHQYQDARALRRRFRYAGEQTCAADGVCQLACPVGINTGDFIIEQRGKRSHPIATALAKASAHNIAAWIAANRTALYLARALADTVGERPVAALTAGLARWLRTPAWLPTMGLPDRIERRSPLDAAMVYVPSCMAWFGGRSPEGDSTANALLALADRAGIPLVVAEKAGSVCCGHPWHSKGIKDAYRRVCEEWIAAVYQASRGGRLPVITDSSSCALSLRNAPPLLSRERAEQLKQLQILGPVHAAEILLEKLAARIRGQFQIVLHPTCALDRSHERERLVDLLRSIGATVIVPHSASCCGVAGDRGLRFPELPAAALAMQKAEIAQTDADFYVSTNLPCQWQLSATTGKQYRSLWCVLEQITR